MITVFLPLITLVFAVLNFGGCLCILPATSLFLWLIFTAVGLKIWLPSWLSRLSQEGNPQLILAAQFKFHWITVLWVSTLFVFAAPTFVFALSIHKFLPQSLPNILAFILYVGIFFFATGDFYRAFAPFRVPGQVSFDYFRARMAIPILFFPPMLLWLLTEDIFLSGLDDGTAILKTFAMVPIFFSVLYLLSPTLFNLAWAAKPLPNPEMEKEICALAKQAKVPLAGMRLWETFGEPLPNAAVAGLASRYRFLYLTKYLLEIFSPQEIKAIVAHELGHFRLGHVWTYLIFSLNLAFLSLSIGLVLYWYYPSFMSNHETIYFWFEFSFFFGAYFLLFSTLARYCEWQADMFAASLVAPQTLAQTLQTISELIMQSPKFLPWWTETHPRFPVRISNIFHWNGSIEKLRQNASFIRIGMILFAMALFIFSWPLIQKSLFLSKANEEFLAKRFENARLIQKPLLQAFRMHPEVLTLSAKLAIAEGNFLKGLILSIEAAFNLEFAFSQSFLEKTQHSAPPEVAFQLQFMEFFLQSPYLNRINWVTPFYESFNFIKIAFGQR